VGTIDAQPRFVFPGHWEECVSASDQGCVAYEWNPGTHEPVAWQRWIPGYYHLESGSPCVDTGTAGGAPTTDIEGFARPCGNGVDMGAYERGQCPATYVKFVRGDTNADGTVDLSDAITVLLGLFAGRPSSCLDAADANDSGAIDIADPICILGYLFAGGGALPPPSVACGVDPTIDELGCESSSPCAREITIIYDNYAAVPGLTTDWGFAALVETELEEVLLDTGAQGSIYLNNATKLGLDFSRIDRLVFSHIHYDHVDGRSAVFPRLPPIPVYIPASFPDSFRQEIRSRKLEPIDVGGAATICDRLHSSGEFPGLEWEQSLFLRTREGVVVMTGCAHQGIVFIVTEAKRQLKEDVYLVLGGFHLFQSNDAAIGAIIASFRDLGVKKVAPCHCSGNRTRQLFREAYGTDYIELGVGSRIPLHF
jgi:7,8-dihydropterin-6-yl-methyl-4-(beta-D-ribofuranosyl)aminobenzene 5'-phosphate synthase